MAFTDLDSKEGLKKLDDFLLGASYIEGVEPSSKDVKVFEKVDKDAARGFVNVARWYKHIASLSDEERREFAGAASGAPPAAEAAAAKAPDNDDDMDDLFDDEDEDEEEAYRKQQERAAVALKMKEERDAAKAASGKKKEAPKSQIIFEVKPWDDTTDLAAMEASVRSINIEGATWGAGKKVPIGYGIFKLQILCTILDDLVQSTEVIEEKITEFEDYVQSVDVVAFNKL